jgi:hypothetical protein
MTVLECVVQPAAGGGGEGEIKDIEFNSFRVWFDDMHGNGFLCGVTHDVAVASLLRLFCIISPPYALDPVTRRTQNLGCHARLDKDGIINGYIDY